MEALSILESKVGWSVDHCQQYVVPNIGSMLDQTMIERNYAKRSQLSGSLRVLFVSRIVPKKNLLGALEILRSVTVDVYFSIYGPIEDENYWEKCCEAMKTLPANINCEYLGHATPVNIKGMYLDHDLMLFPTLGENYGHVIVEAICHGLPIIISDKTPWTGDANNGVLKTIKLGDVTKYSESINTFKRGAYTPAMFFRYYTDHVFDSCLIKKYDQMLFES